MEPKIVGQSLTRVESAAKCNGTAKYVDDIELENMLHGLTIRTKSGPGLIKNIKFDPSIDWSEFTIVRAEDIPGKNYVALIEDDQPYLASNYTAHPEEPVVLIAHSDPQKLKQAKDKITIEIEAKTPIFDLTAAKEAAIIDQKRVIKEFLVEKGNVDEVFKKPNLSIVDGTYSTGAQEHLYIEPNGIIATHTDSDTLTVMGSLQCPYYVHKALKTLFGFPDDKIRVIQTATGGGFGGKEEYPSMIAGHAALLAWKARRPVKLIYDRAEDMAATTKRHPSETHIRSAFDAAGKLVALDIDFTLDGGAYTTLSPVVLSRGTLHASGVYDCPSIRIKSRALRTDTPPNGAFRGFGAPQSVFAIEQHMNTAARKLGISDLKIRENNFLSDGSTTATGQIIRDHVDMKKLLARACELANFESKRTAYEHHNQKGTNVRRGIGLATFLHGAGFTGSGEKNMASKAGVMLSADGKVQILTANTEIGQGAATIFTQIACDALNLAPSMIEVVTPDTKYVPNSGPTVASRTTMVVGNLVQKACLELRTVLSRSCGLNENYSNSAFAEAARKYTKEHGELRCYATYEQPSHVTWDDKTYKGDAYGTYAWAVYIADVEVDLLSYTTKVHDFVAVQEIGKVVNPILAAGQIEGGVAQGIGMCLYEKVVWREGRMANNRMTNYIIPTAQDLNSIRVEFLEVPYPHGPQGAKGIGELPLDGSAAAVAGAIENALNCRIAAIPCLPEQLMEIVNGKKH